MQLPPFIQKAIQRWGLLLFVVVPLVLLGLPLGVLSIARVSEQYSLLEIAGVSIVAIVVLSVMSLWEQWASRLRVLIRKRWRSSRPTARILCLSLFSLAFTVYFLSGDEVGSVPATLEVGVIAVSVTLGGLVLNAGLNLCGEMRKEFIVVAQKFIAVVILMLIFLPTLHIVDLAGGIDTNSFEPGDPVAWFRGAMFWIAAASFYASVVLFIIALVDLAYAVFGLDGTENASFRKYESSDPNDQCDRCENAGSSASGQP